jgi:hypothetical protein
MQYFKGLIMRRLVIAAAVFVSGLSAVNKADADPILVSYTVSGSPGNYDLDFSVTNNMLAWPSQLLYFFAVRLESGHHITGSPADWFDNGADANWFNYGGSNTEYNNTWRNGIGGIYPGNTLSGFIVHDPDLVAPSEVSWSAVSYSVILDPYTGGGNFITDWNPGFEGLASPVDSAAVPEPSSVILCAFGCAGLIGYAWRRRNWHFRTAP